MSMVYWAAVKEWTPSDIQNVVLHDSYLCVALGLQAAGVEYATWDDGRKLCLECLETAVIDTKEAQPLYRDILKFYKNIGMMIDQEIPMLLVERSALNEAREGEKEVGKPHLFLEVSVVYP